MNYIKILYAGYFVNEYFLDLFKVKKILITYKVNPSVISAGRTGQRSVRTAPASVTALRFIQEQGSVVSTNSTTILIVCLCFPQIAQKPAKLKIA